LTTASELCQPDDRTYKNTILLLLDIGNIGKNVQRNHTLASDGRLHDRIKGRGVYAWLDVMTAGQSTIYSSRAFTSKAVLSFPALSAAYGADGERGDVGVY